MFLTYGYFYTIYTDLTIWMGC